MAAPKKDKQAASPGTATRAGEVKLGEEPLTPAAEAVISARLDEQADKFAAQFAALSTDLATKFEQSSSAVAAVDNSAVDVRVINELCAPVSDGAGADPANIVDSQSAQQPVVDDIGAIAAPTRAAVVSISEAAQDSVGPPNRADDSGVPSRDSEETPLDLNSVDEAVFLKITALLEDLGLARNPSKGEWESTQAAMQHLGLIIDTKAGEFRAPEEKLQKIAVEAKNLILQSVHRRRWVPAKHLASLAGKAQFLYLAIPAARFYLRELHTVLSTKSSWQGKVRVTKQLHRDLEWWTSVPSQQNGRPVWRAVETAYIHVDSSDFGWGAVLDDHHQARGFWGLQDRGQHITFKELKAVRYAVESFLPHLVGRNVLLHEDNQAVVAVLTHPTTRSPDMMLELRKLWFLLDTHGIHIRPRQA